MTQEQIDTIKILEELNLLKKEIENIKIAIAEDLEFSKRVDEAWDRYDKGKFNGMKKDDFLKELEEW